MIPQRHLVSGMILLLIIGASGTSTWAQRPSRRSADAGRLKDQLTPILELSEAELLRLIPDRAGFHFVGCPNCTGGTQEGQLDWTLDRPDEVFCRYCRMQFPNEKFPENQVVRVVNPRGEVQEYPCWESPDPPPKSGWKVIDPDPKRGARYFFRAKGWFLAREYFAGAAAELSVLYAQTGDRSYARRAALIIDRFAQVYPGYCVHYDVPFTPKHLFSGSQRHPFPVSDYRAAKWSWWAYLDIPESLIQAYGRIRSSGEIDAEMTRRIENDFFRASVEFVRGFPPGRSNMDPKLIGGLVAAGKVLNEPEYMHDAVARIDALAEGQFYSDGMWREGTLSYHNQSVGGLLLLADSLKGYTDPPNYRHPRDGSRFDDLNLLDRFPLLAKARALPGRLRYPDGRVVAIHDTWAGRIEGPATTAAGPDLLSGYGHARLGMGRGDDQTQAHLHFSGGYGHQHQDLLSLTVFARGAERLSDLGYTHTRYRVWGESTLSHNTVMVDGREQATGSARKPNDGALRLFVPDGESLQIVEAAAPRVYPETTSDYRRMLVLVETEPNRSYVLDVFRVVGGKLHEYVLAGDADHDGAVDADLPSTRFGDTLLPPGVRFRLPIGESVPGDAEGRNIAYAFVRDVARMHPSGGWTARFTSEAPTSGELRIHGLSEPGTEIFKGRGPSIRRAGSDDADLDRFTMPMLIERREGQDLSSTFAHVFEPTVGQPVLRSVERLTPDEGNPVDVVVRVAWEGGVDTLLIATDPAGSTVRHGDHALQGRVGFIRERAGKIERMTLIGGTRLSSGGSQLDGQGIVRGQVVGVLRKAKGAAVDGLVVEGPLPNADILKGRTVVVSDPEGFTQGHEVTGVADYEGKPVIVLVDDPAIEIDGEGMSRQSYFPSRTWPGGNRFEIATMATRKAIP